jgi:nicotinamidase-related amidase
MFTAENTVLIIIDIQEKLFRVMHGKEELTGNITKLIKGLKLLDIPVIITEQNPAGLGLTIPEILSLLPDMVPVPKFSFSCCKEEVFRHRLESLKRKQVLVTGIETHICVYQTAVELSKSGYEVQVIKDCVSSRTPENRDIALTRLSLEGIMPATTEMILFELLQTARHAKFKEISAIIK